MKLVLVLLVAIGMTSTTIYAQADVIKIPIGEQNSDHDSKLPQRGTLKSKVLAEHGEPTKKYAPVGNPPITRWSYTDFDVYFEYDHVINSVKHFKPTNSQ
ncbi:MAG: hypothetical protein ACI4NJ_06635 [Cellvibrio sp.]